MYDKKINEISLEADKDFLDKIDKVKKGGSFLITVSIFNKKKAPKRRLETFLLANDFPSVEIDKLKKKIAEIMDNLKKSCI